MKKRLVGFSLVFLLLITSIAFAHVGEDDEYDLDASSIYPISTWEIVGYGTLAFLALILFVIFHGNKLKEPGKKTTYYLICLVSALVTLYLIVTTLHLNYISESKGPVHYHADFEIWVCDKQIQLFAPSGLSNKQGTNLLHAHDDNRIHVEGVLLNSKASSVGAFFHALGGHINDYSMLVESRDGIVEVENGQQCNSLPGKLYFFVNGQQVQNIKDYAIAQYENVPPGDRIKIIFTEKDISQIDQYIKAEPRPQQ